MCCAVSALWHPITCTHQPNMCFAATRDGELLRHTSLRIMQRSLRAVPHFSPTKQAPTAPIACVKERALQERHSSPRSAGTLQTHFTTHHIHSQHQPWICPQSIAVLLTTKRKQACVACAVNTRSVPPSHACWRASKPVRGVECVAAQKDVLRLSGVSGMSCPTSHAIPSTHFCGQFGTQGSASRT
jgi:hypothetical protein